MIRMNSLVAAATLLVFASVTQAAAPSCQITFNIGTSTQLYAASVFALYTNAPGGFQGDANNVSCTWLGGTLGNAGDSDQFKTLTLTMVGTPNPIKGPKDVVKCTWIPTSRFPLKSDFDLTAQSGTNTSFQQVPANITVTTIVCSGDLTTTTTTTTTTSSTTTTTIPAKACGDFDGSGKLQTSDALAVLRAAVGQASCVLCLCDIDGGGTLGATDALLALKKAVGLTVTLKCPAC